ncbi:MAG: iron ABC transporter permease [Candidatus Methanoplasma sp.]|jgi:iron complex transport system permease protein|nr:iron ABC transporter permease [Candidatus Methanoplasma sp.]
MRLQKRSTAEIDPDFSFSNVSEQFRKYIWKKYVFIIICLMVSLVVAIYALTIGTYDIGFWECFRILVDHLQGNILDSTKDVIIWNVRLPRILLGAVVGAGLAVGGATMQSVLKNPLADSYTTGISSGASFGATIAIILGLTVAGGNGAIVANAFIFSLVPVLLIVVISGLRKTSPTTMILSGIAIMYVFNAITTVLMLMSDPDDLAAVYSWQVGSLSTATWDSIPISSAVTVAGVIALALLSNKLNILSAGDESAKSLGVDANKIRIISLLIVSLITASIVSFTGIIGFVGLVSPHVARLFIGSDNKFLIPASATFGVMLVLISDLVGRTVIAPAVLQVGVVTAFLGGPLFLYLLIKQRKEIW